MLKIISRKLTHPVDKKGAQGHRLFAAFMALALVIVMTCSSLSPLSARQTAGQGTACGYNLHNLKSGIEMYANDNGGRYPPYLSFITPNHLGSIPTCPSAGIDTYSCGYIPGTGEYFVCCVGRNHPELLENMPAFNSKTGMITTVNPNFKGPEEERNTDTATSLILLGILSIVSYLTYRKK